MDQLHIPGFITLHQFAHMVQDLRKVQKAGGKGYKTDTDQGKAAPLEQKVDQAVARILQFWGH